MKKTNLLLTCVAAIVAATPAAVTASSVEELVIGMDQPGIPYRWMVDMSGSDAASLARHVGAWSWEDSSLFAPGTDPVGWTHNADWIRLTLETEVVLTIRLENKGDVLLPPDPRNETPFAGNDLFPGFTLWSGVDVDGESFHSFNNHGAVNWAEDLTYVGHQAPPTTGETHTRHMIQQSFTLGPGDYTFVFGGKSESTAGADRQGYQATFTTAPVPEPGTALLALVGGLALLNRRRRFR